MRIEEVDGAVRVTDPGMAPVAHATEGGEE
jgi:hypothetical protein